MDLSIIIVNWNSSDYVRSCLISIYKETKNSNFEIIVIDNASFDGCEKFIETEFPKITFIQLNQNVGFARANNLGFQNSSGECILFLNPDTKLVGPAIDTLLGHLESIPNAGALGCKILNSDLSIQTSCVQPFPTILNQIFDIDILKSRTPKLKLWGNEALFQNNDSPPAIVEAVSGACLMIKRDVFKEVGLFNTDYFMFAEDIDLCYKVWRAGHTIYFISDAQIIHYGGGSTEKHDISYFNGVLRRESTFKFLQTHKGKLTAQLFKISTIFVSLVRLMLIAPFISISHRRDHSLQYAYNKWKKIMRWSLGFEKWASRLNNNKT